MAEAGWKLSSTSGGPGQRVMQGFHSSCPQKCLQPSAVFLSFYSRVAAPAGAQQQRSVHKSAQPGDHVGAARRRASALA